MSKVPFDPEDSPLEVEDFNVLGCAGQVALLAIALGILLAVWFGGAA